MSFLLRRNLPLAFQGYYDGFQRAAQNPVTRPWGMWGTMSSNAYLDGSNQMILPSAPSGQTGGVSFEFMPFTPNYGHEYQVIWPISGVGDQFLQLFLMPNWSIVGPNFTNTLGVRLMHSPVGTGDTVRIQEWSSLTSLATEPATASSPVVLDGSVTLTLKVWNEDDKSVAVWVNGTLCCQAVLDSAYVTGPRRRGMNLMQFSVTNAKYQYANVYDRPASCPGNNHWSSIFYDDFSRADGAVGNGWTQIGTNAQLTSGEWVHTGTTDGSIGLIRDSGITSGRQRVEAVVGTAVSPNTTADAGLVLCSNSAGTQGIAANIYSGSLYLSRFSTSLNNNQPTWNDFTSRTSGITVAAGDKLTFSVFDGTAWLEQNGVRVLYAREVNSVVPATNSWIGQRVNRKTFSNSSTWTDCRIYSGI